MPASILIAESERLVREGLRSLLESRGDLEVVAEVGEAHELVEGFVSHKPDIALIDARLTGISGVEATRRVRAACPQARCILMSSSAATGVVRAALLAGAVGFVAKSASAAELFESIDAALAGRSFSLRTTGASLAELVGLIDARYSDGALLTGRQREVTKLVAQGRSTRQIARQLGVSVKTVETHRTNAMKRLDAHKASDLVRYAIREGLVEA